MKKLLFFMVGILLLSACNPSSKNEKDSGLETEPEFVLSELWRTDTLLTTCESVLYDSTRDILFVACISGNPSEKDGVGFISRLGTNGEILETEWVSGLDAPKGMGVYKNNLYVTNIDELIIIDIENAVVSEKIPVEGAKFLNDLSISSSGKVYFSDSETGKIHILEDEKVSDWITEGLERPNGLFVEEERILLTSSGSSDLRIIDPVSGEFEIVTTEIGAGDGVEFTGIDGYYITSSWSGELFLIQADFSKKSLLRTQEDGINSADIGLNKKKQIIYVPTFFDNRVVAYQLEKK